MTSPAMEEARSIPTRDAAAYLSLAKTMRRLAHSARREALKWEADGNLKNYIAMRHECDRLWGSAKFYLLHAKIGALPTTPVSVNKAFTPPNKGDAPASSSTLSLRGAGR